MKVLIIQPPKYFWPYISSDDNYLVPQSLVCLGAAVREAGMDARLVDCSPMRIGWKSLAKLIAEEAPDVVGVGENHALYAHESLKVLKLAKEILPRAVTVAGGSHFTNLIEDTLCRDYIDFVVLKEGEDTFIELLRKIKGGEKDFSSVKGIAYRKDGGVVRTTPRPLIADLDTLPLPAYDLLPMEMYGRSKYLFSPGGTTIHHSRGCVSSCRFCAWWLQMGESVIEENGKVRYKPKWRTKSPGRSMEEVRELVNRHGKRCLVFVDEFWNNDPDWSSEFCDLLIAADLGVEWFAFMRADAVVRDEKLGILEKMVESGLVHVAIGVERYEKNELNKMGKGFYNSSLSLECFHLLRDKYPRVFRQGTFIIGVRSETKESLYEQVAFARELELDYPGFHPITPVPGTAVWDESREKGWIEITDFSDYDWMTPIMSSDFMTREEIEEQLIVINKKFVSVKWFLKGILSGGRYKRLMYAWWVLVTIRVVWDSLRRFVWPLKTQTYKGLVKPPWYDD